jgi:anti-sigma B factor antagonist
MDVTTKGYESVELITIKGRVDSVEAAHLVAALETALSQGKYKIVIDMSGLEYMSSAGFRALGDAQRNSQRHRRGEVILAQVPERIREALDLVGFSEYFKMIDTVAAALEFARNQAAGNATVPSQPLPGAE